MDTEAGECLAGVLSGGLAGDAEGVGEEFVWQTFGAFLEDLALAPAEDVDSEGERGLAKNCASGSRTHDCRGACHEQGCYSKDPSVKPLHLYLEHLWD